MLNQTEIRKATPVCLFFLVLFGGHLCSQPKNDVLRHNLHGRVKSINVSAALKIGTYNSDKSNWLKKKITSTEEWKYDEAGNMTAHFTYDKHGNIIQKFTYLYDTSGCRAKAFHYNKNDSIDYSYTFSFANNGQKMEEHCFNPKDSLVAKSVYTYNANGHCTAWYYYYPIDTLFSKEIYSYDNDTLTQTFKYSKGKKLPFQYHYSYDQFDENGNWQRQILYLINSAAYEYIYRKIEYY